MARITVEDCLSKIDSQYDLVLLAKERTSQLNAGDKPLVPEDKFDNRNKAAPPTSFKLVFLLRGALYSFHLRIYLKSPIPDAAKVLTGPAEIPLTLIALSPKSAERYITLASNAAFATPITL